MKPEFGWYSTARIWDIALAERFDQLREAVKTRFNRLIRGRGSGMGCLVSRDVGERRGEISRAIFGKRVRPSALVYLPRVIKDDVRYN